MHMLVEVGQILYMGGHYGPLGELGMLYFTEIHIHSGIWWWCGRASSTPLPVWGRVRGGEEAVIYYAS